MLSSRWDDFGYGVGRFSSVRKQRGKRWKNEKNPNIRSRLVAKDFKTENMPELFAGTPPLEALRIICSEAATEGTCEKVVMINEV